MTGVISGDAAVESSCETRRFLEGGSFRATLIELSGLRTNDGALNGLPVILYAWTMYCIVHVTKSEAWGYPCSSMLLPMTRRQVTTRPKSWQFRRSQLNTMNPFPSYT